MQSDLGLVSLLSWGEGVVIGANGVRLALGPMGVEPGLSYATCGEGVEAEFCSSILWPNK